MDLFTNKANNVLRKINETKLIYSSEEDAEDTTLTPRDKASMPDPKVIKSIRTSKELTKKPGQVDPATKKLETGMSALYNKLTANVNKIASTTGL